MTSLKKFLIKNKSESNSIVSSDQQRTELVAYGSAKEGILDILRRETDFAARDSEEFSEKVAAALASDDVVDEISDLLGEPGESESQEDFTKRAKSIMKIVLKKKLGVL